MRFRKLKALNKFTLENGMPKFTHVLIGVVSFYFISHILRLLYGIFYVNPEYWEQVSSFKIETQVILSQVGAFPSSCIIFLFVSCWIRKPGKLYRILRASALMTMMIIIVQININFVIHLTNVENANPYHFVARFIGLTVYLYLMGVTFLVARMSRTSTLEWKVFDGIMLFLALLAFSGVVIQKVTGPLNIVGALAVISGTLAFALKFCKMTNEYYVLIHKNQKNK